MFVIMDTEVKAPYAANPDLSNILFLKPGVSQNITLHASPTAKDSPFKFKLFPIHFLQILLNTKRRVTRVVQ